MRYRDLVHRGMNYVGMYDTNRAYYKDEVVTYAGGDVWVCTAKKVEPSIVLDSANWERLYIKKDITIDNRGTGTDPNMFELQMEDSPGLLTVIYYKGE